MSILAARGITNTLEPNREMQSQYFNDAVVANEDRVITGMIGYEASIFLLKVISCGKYDLAMLCSSASNAVRASSIR